jgi:hypothetical protein
MNRRVLRMSGGRVLGGHLGETTVKLDRGDDDQGTIAVAAHTLSIELTPVPDLT